MDPASLMLYAMITWFLASDAIYKISYFLCLLICVTRCRLPIVQCKQNYMSMDISLRNDVKELMDKHSKRFGWVFEIFGFSIFSITQPVGGGLLYFLRGALLRRGLFFFLNHHKSSCVFLNILYNSNSQGLYQEAASSMLATTVWLAKNKDCVSDTCNRE